MCRLGAILLGRDDGAFGLESVVRLEGGGRCSAGVHLDHVRVARGRIYRDATPTSGIIYEGGGEEVLDVEVKVVRLPD